MAGRAGRRIVQIRYTLYAILGQHQRKRPRSRPAHDDLRENADTVCGSEQSSRETQRCFASHARKRSDPATDAEERVSRRDRDRISVDIARRSASFRSQHRWTNRCQIFAVYFTYLETVCEHIRRERTILGSLT